FAISGVRLFFYFTRLTIKLVIALVITIPLGVKAMVIGHVVTSAIAFFINAYMPGKLFGYGAFAQLKDMVPVFIASAAMALFVYIFEYFIDNLYLKLIVGGIVGLSTYLIMSYLLKIEELKEFTELIIKTKKRFGKASA
ncbi:MAG TPA: hypothetical protein PKH58_12615, partial [Paludibacteraceae bacterium]|nr:hypothetical protein [Paludibacteraceae bacterium]